MTRRGAVLGFGDAVALARGVLQLFVIKYADNAAFRMDFLRLPKGGSRLSRQTGARPT